MKILKSRLVTSAQPYRDESKRPAADNIKVNAPFAKVLLILANRLIKNYFPLILRLIESLSSYLQSFCASTIHLFCRFQPSCAIANSMKSTAMEQNSFIAYFAQIALSLIFSSLWKQEDLQRQEKVGKNRINVGMLV